MWLHIPIYICMYVCMYVCIYIYIYMACKVFPNCVAFSRSRPAAFSELEVLPFSRHHMRAWWGCPDVALPQRRRRPIGGGRRPARLLRAASHDAQGGSLIFTSAVHERRWAEGAAPASWSAGAGAAARRRCRGGRGGACPTRANGCRGHQPVAPGDSRGGRTHTWRWATSSGPR